MKKPVVFDAEIAEKVGVAGAIILQKLDEGINTEPDMVEALYFCRAHTVRDMLKELVQKGLVFKEGIQISTEFIEPDLEDVKHSYSDDFERIWTVYNKDKKNRGSKKKAYERYKKSPFRKLPLEIQEEIIYEYRGDASDIKYTKYFSTFLSEEIFENYAPDICVLKTSRGDIKGYLLENKFFYLNKNNQYSSFDLTGKLQSYKNSGVLMCK